MKERFRLAGSVILLVLLITQALILSLNTTRVKPAQTGGSTVSSVAQITSSDRHSYAGDISGDGRFVVIESTGNIATEDPNNADLNREIFLFDYAQRRIFQITHTKSALKDTTDAADDTDDEVDNPANIALEVSNNRPVISADGRWIAFTSNAPTPASFDANDPNNQAALAADGNQEVFLYEIPAVAPADLSRGAEVAPADLSSGTFIRVTATPASRTPQPGTATVAPFVAFDNRDAAVNADGSIVAFISSRDIAGASGGPNTDANPEVFIYNRTTRSITQLTNTQGAFVFSSNPSVSGDGSIVAFISNANIPDARDNSGHNADGNAEIYTASFDGATVSNIRQVTRTTAASASTSVNILSPGRRLSRDGSRLAFESTARLDGDGSIQSTTALFIYDLRAGAFTQVGPRATSGSDVLRFPSFTGDSSTLVFASALNFRADGTIVDGTDDGLNPNRTVQLFSTPASAPYAFTRLTDTTAPSGGGVASMQPYVSDTARRIAFSLAGTELGGDNPDNLTEAFYLLVSPVASEAPASDTALTYATGASQRNVVPPPSPSPTPTPPAVTSLAPGMLSIARSTVALAPSSQTAASASERRRPALPIELNGVSVSIGGAAAGLYFVSSGEIRFVVPPGLAATASDKTYPVVINNNGAVIRGAMQIITAQPDIFSDVEGPGGRAAVFNITNPFFMLAGPFTVTSPNENGETVATVLRIILTGARKAQKSEVTVRIGETEITGDSILYAGPTDTPGFDQIDVRIPESLAGAGDVPVIVTISSAGSSRPASSAPHIQVN